MAKFGGGKQQSVSTPSSTLGITRVFSDTGPMISPEFFLIISIVFTLVVLLAKIMVPI